MDRDGLDNFVELFENTASSGGGTEASPSEPRRTYDTDDGQRGLWCDPDYRIDDEEDYYSPTRPSYGGRSSHTERRAPRERSTGGFWTAAITVVICALVSGLMAVLCTGWVLRYERAHPSNVHVVLGTASVADSTLQTTIPGYTGRELSGTEIYYGLAKKQVVGVNTSITTNIFGQASDSAVSGSGFIISEDGYILTNYHVISYAAVYDGELSVLMYDGTSMKASLVGYVEDNDIAVIKVDAAGLTPAVLGNSDAMQVGETVYAVGNPLGELTFTLTDGVVSALDRVITTRDPVTNKLNSMNMFQVNAAVNEGNSGGPVYNTRGEVIGIVTAKSGESGVEGLGFAIPVNDALSLATQLIERGHVSTVVLGVTAENTSSAYSSFIQEYYGYPDGALVDTVKAGSAAETAGIQPGDIIISVGGREVSSANELKLTLRHFAPGDAVTVVVYRTGKSLGRGEDVRLEVTFIETAPE